HTGEAIAHRIVVAHGAVQDRHDAGAVDAPADGTQNPTAVERKIVTDGAVVDGQVAGVIDPSARSLAETTGRGGAVGLVVIEVGVDHVQAASVEDGAADPVTGAPGRGEVEEEGGVYQGQEPSVENGASAATGRGPPVTDRQAGDGGVYARTHDKDLGAVEQ